MAYCTETAKKTKKTSGFGVEHTSKPPNHMITAPPARPSAASHQLQHPRASSAGGKASKQAKHNDDGAGANEDIGGIGGVVRYQGDVGAQHQLPPYSHREQDGSCYLSERQRGGRDRCSAGKVVG